jgi:hypothetical protein
MGLSHTRCERTPASYSRQMKYSVLRFCYPFTFVVDSGRMTETLQRSDLGLRTRTLVVAIAALLLLHAVLQGVGAATFWRPCADNGNASDACMYLQYEAPTPWWSYLSWLWLVEIGLLIAAIVALGRSGRRAWPAITALVFVVLFNLVVDYGFTPAFNGGYTSADSPPGYGLIGAVGIGIAGCVLPIALLRRKPQPRA